MELNARLEPTFFLLLSHNSIVFSFLKHVFWSRQTHLFARIYFQDELFISLAWSFFVCLFVVMVFNWKSLFVTTTVVCIFGIQGDAVSQASVPLKGNYFFSPGKRVVLYSQIWSTHITYFWQSSLKEQSNPNTNPNLGGCFIGTLNGVVTISTCRG